MLATRSRFLTYFFSSRFAFPKHMHSFSICDFAELQSPMAVLLSGVFYFISRDCQSRSRNSQCQPTIFLCSFIDFDGCLYFAPFLVRNSKKNNKTFTFCLRIRFDARLFVLDIVMKTVVPAILHFHVVVFL